MNSPAEARLPLLLIVTGLPCSGKTTVARQIAAALELPLVTKDDIKERLFDTLGWSDRVWSRKLGNATYEILYYVIEAMLSGGSSLVAESNFSPLTAGERFETIREKHAFRIGVVECVARAGVLKERWQRRAAFGTRHPGHNDAAALEEFLSHIDLHTGTDGYGRLGAPQLADDVEMPVWTVDTSQAVSLKALIKEIGQVFDLPLLTS